MTAAPSIDLAVLGLGYVGLPLAREASRAGLRVVGFDLDARKVDGLNAGRSHVDDITNDDVEAMRQSGFRATANPDDLTGAATFVICVPTPLSNDGAPDLDAVLAAADLVSRHLHPGCLVVLESTTYPGTTDEVGRPFLETAASKAGSTSSSPTRRSARIPETSASGPRRSPRWSAATGPMPLLSRRRSTPSWW